MNKNRLHKDGGGVEAEIWEWQRKQMKDRFDQYALSLYL